MNTTGLMAFFAMLLSASFVTAQQSYWQHHVDYKMEIDMDVTNYNFTGHQKLTFSNNSPDTLHQVFYHLFFNAFQPGSMMDELSRTIADPDQRVGDRISQLQPDEIGKLEPTSMKQDGKKLDYKVRGTILQVPLRKPLLPGQQTVLDMDFAGQVPLQVRRSGRDNREGIALSMSQWYPKLCNHDIDGWHPNPYIGREFYAIWGDYDVKISIDSDYILGGTGYLQNNSEVGYGYEEQGVTFDHAGKDKLTWHFVAPKVHDFVWAADPGYTHVWRDVANGTRLHFLYKGQDSTMIKNWTALVDYTEKALLFANENFGEYPYKQYSVIQGGDGGMEYPMATLITGRRNLGSLVGVMVHELMHSWYQMMLASNELLYPWFDEGFTMYAGELVMNDLFPREDHDPRDLHQSAYASYFSIAGTDAEDPLTTHGDHYRTNRAYGIASYYKGQVYVHQLSYIVGEDVLRKSLLRYFNEWKYKHPRPNDFLRIVEKESGLILDWYHEYFVNSTATIDYGIRAVHQTGNKTEITIERIGRMPMPVEVVIKSKSGTEEMHYIPMVMMHGQKQPEQKNMKIIDHDEWPWTHKTYTISIDIPAGDIATIEIDPSLRMADVDRSNNLLLLPKDTRYLLFPNR